MVSQFLYKAIPIAIAAAMAATTASTGAATAPIAGPTIATMEMIPPIADTKPPMTISNGPTTAVIPASANANFASAGCCWKYVITR